MSADNGIYILKTPADDGEGFEYRVRHAQAIDNIYWDDTAPGHNNPDGVPEIVVEYFGKCDVLTEEEAHKKAFELEEEVLNDDFGILEYGVSTIELPYSFTIYRRCDRLGFNRVSKESE